MPEQTPLRKFMKSLETKVTDTTKALESAWQAMPASERAALLASLSSAASLTPLPGNLETLLRNHGLGDKEIAHINEWPNQPKQDAVAWLIAVSANNNVAFRWELHGGGGEVAAADPSPPVPGPGQVTITFRSPQTKVTLWPAPTFGEVNVSV